MDLILVEMELLEHSKPGSSMGPRVSGLEKGYGLALNYCQMGLNARRLLGCILQEAVVKSDVINNE